MAWFDEYIYVLSDDAYFSTLTRDMLSRKAFNALYRGTLCISGLSGKKVDASVSYDELRVSANSLPAYGQTYAAGDSVLVLHKDTGKTYANKWQDGRPRIAPTARADITPWLAHVEKLIPDEWARTHVLDCMAFKLQNPRGKINHAILHGGAEGCGKDSLWYPFQWAVCGPTFRNRALINYDNLSSQWGYAWESEVLVLNELHEPTSAGRREAANRLKPVIAAPPDTITVNRKMAHPYDVPNRMFVLAFTNEYVPISLSPTDRRWMCVWSDSPKMSEKDAGRALGLVSRRGAASGCGLALCSRRAQVQSERRADFYRMAQVND
jgi:hypothetical protein